jgi:perosamine synthetase
VSTVIPLFDPELTAEDADAVARAVAGRWRPNGPLVQAFEKAVAAVAGRPHGVAVNSAGSGLLIAIRALGIGPGDEVIVPALAFPATADAVLHVGATPIFVDCDPRSLNVRAADAEALITSRTRAIIGVETYGNPAGMLELAMLCNKHELPLLEDCCDALGGRMGREPIGRFGRLAVFSFSTAMPVTTGEGGVIVTHDDALARACRALRNHGQSAVVRTTGSRSAALELGDEGEPERLGFSARMTEMQAALGLSQLRRLDETLERRQQLAQSYVRRLSGNTDVMLPTVPADAFIAWNRFVIRLSDQFGVLDRDAVIEGLRRHEIGASPGYSPVPFLPWYERLFGHKPGEFPVAESVSQRTIALPFYNRLAERDIDLVCQTFAHMIQRQVFHR